MQDAASSWPTTDKSDWLDLVRHELKGQDPADLDWVLNERVRLSPFYTLAEAPPRPPLARSKGSWQPGSYVAAGSAATVNAQALAELAGGAEALLFNLYHQPSVEEMAEILAGIELPYISLHTALYFPDRDPAELFRDLITYLRRQQVPLAKITGSVDFDPLFDWSDPPIKPLIRLLRFVHQYMPNFRVLQVNGTAFNTGPERADAELALTIAKGAEYLSLLQTAGIEPLVANQHLQFAMSLGTSFYVDVAKLRALRLLWANVLKAFGVKQSAPARLAAHSGLDSLTDQVNDNLLRLTTQAMAAITGSADVLFLLPADCATNTGETPFGRRMARNIQQMLKLEAGFDDLQDPAAGSHYLETMTEQLAQAAWGQFQDIEAAGGFAVVQSI